MSTNTVEDLRHVGVAEAAQIVHVSERTLRQWLADRKIKHTRYGSTIRIPLAELLRGF